MTQFSPFFGLTRVINVIVNINITLRLSGYENRSVVSERTWYLQDHFTISYHWRFYLAHLAKTLHNTAILQPFYLQPA